MNQWIDESIPLRDGVTGNTSGFELEDEGSIPSPAANLFKLNSKGTSIHYIGSYLYLEANKNEASRSTNYALIVRRDSRQLATGTEGR